jgi:hypothetical protein
MNSTMPFSIAFTSEASWTGMTGRPALALYYKNNCDNEGAPADTFERLVMEVPVAHMIPKMIKLHPKPRYLICIVRRIKFLPPTSYTTIANETPSTSTLGLNKRFCDKVGRDLLVWVVLYELSNSIHCGVLWECETIIYGQGADR